MPRLLIVPTGESGEFRPERISRTGVEMVGVAEQCGHHPTVIVLDDSYRADLSTCDVLEAVVPFVNWMPPLLVLATWQDAGMQLPMVDSSSTSSRVGARLIRCAARATTPPHN